MAIHHIQSQQEMLRMAYLSQKYITEAERNGLSFDLDLDDGGGGGDSAGDNGGNIGGGDYDYDFNTGGGGGGKEEEDTMHGPAFCLLIKDDNSILSEWVGYHYHTMKMRRLIVAVDPESVTSPREVLEKWTREGSGGRFDLRVTLWENDSFMPDYWHERNHSRLPDLVKKIKYELDEDKVTGTEEDLLRGRFKSEEERTLALEFNDFVNRQQRFLYECNRQVKREHNTTGISWVVHTDSDEYLVPNPWVSGFVYDGKATRKKFFDEDVLRSIFPRVPAKDSLVTFFHEFAGHSAEKYRTLRSQNKLAVEHNTNTSHFENGCTVFPRILFGAKEVYGAGGSRVTVSREGSTTTTWNHTRFETLRWKYHQDFNQHEDRKSGYPGKGMIDITKNDLNGEEGFRLDAVPVRLPSIHRLSNRCLPLPNNNYVDNGLQQVQPLAVYHYLGSLEHYMSRPGDNRRDPAKHDHKSRYAVYWGDTNRETPSGDERFWIGGWFDRFLAEHGPDAVYSVFGEEFATRTKTGGGASSWLRDRFSS